MAVVLLSLSLPLPDAVAEGIRAVFRSVIRRPVVVGAAEDSESSSSFSDDEGSADGSGVADGARET